MMFGKVAPISLPSLHVFTCCCSNSITLLFLDSRGLPFFFLMLSLVSHTLSTYRSLFSLYLYPNHLNLSAPILSSIQVLSSNCCASNFIYSFDSKYSSQIFHSIVCKRIFLDLVLSFTTSHAIASYQFRFSFS